jgi:serine/threonine protein kinase
VLAENGAERVVLKWVWRESSVNRVALARLRKAATYSHHVLAIQGVIDAVDAQVFISRYHEGALLRDILDDARCDTQTRLLIARQIINGVSSLHQHGLVHGDIRAENVWVTRSGRVIVLDVDQLLLAESNHEHKPRMVALNATTPEHLRAQPLTAASDQFALGSLLVELFTGVSPLVCDGQLAHANVLDPRLPQHSAWGYLPPDSVNLWLQTLANWWQSSARRRPRSYHELESLVLMTEGERIVARSRLADMANDHAQATGRAAIASVVPDYPEPKGKRFDKRVQPMAKIWAALALVSVVFAVLVLPLQSTSGDVHRRLLWVWLDDEGRQTIPEDWRRQLQRRWFEATAPRVGHAKRFSLQWSSHAIELTLKRPRLKALVECGELFCFFRMKPMQGGRDSWHEQVPVRASLRRWQAVMDRAITFQTAHSAPD